jgi:hypothetical protein
MVAVPQYGVRSIMHSVYYLRLCMYVCCASMHAQALQKLRELRSEGAPVRVAAYTSVISGCKWAKVCM